MMSSKLYQGGAHAKLYAKYRPVYPPTVINTILEYCKQSKCQMKTALDVGCGSGQSTVALAKHFTSVTGMDISDAQISQAPTDIPGVSFRVSPAEDLSFQESGSVDLVTVAQAIHWINLDGFYSEVERVLRPGGVLAVYGYGHEKLDSAHASQLLIEFYNDTLKGYWAEEIAHIDNRYKDIASPSFGTFQRDESLVMSKVMPLSAYIGYLSSWSAYRTLLKQQPKSKVLENLYKRLLEAYGTSEESQSPEPQVEATWPLFMLMCSK